MLSTADAIAHELQTSHRAGRMLEGLIASEGTKGKVILTTDLIAADGEKRLHQTFVIRGWNAKGGGRMLTVEVDKSGDWELGIQPTKLLHIDLAKLAVRDAKAEPRNQDKLLRFAAEAAVKFAWLGEAGLPNSKNGTVIVLEAVVCGYCGRKLTDPVSIERGIGPDCFGKMTGTKTITGRKAVA